MFQSSKGGLVILGLIILVVLAALGGGAVYLAQVAPPAQTDVHHVLKHAQQSVSSSSSSDMPALPDLPPVPSPN
ncbi:hypothetical protein PT277_03210 [Acetobacteraceae bacterium ESL0709]|nr:hypothetical protein [Acetobacteraceae bacterium ESL0697]MDF7677710.1 hypothetical protein [Acetobacteraceae bacterium ESL0709]